MPGTKTELTSVQTECLRRLRVGDRLSFYTLHRGYRWLGGPEGYVPTEAVNRLCRLELVRSVANGEVVASSPEEYALLREKQQADDRMNRLEWLLYWRGRIHSAAPVEQHLNAVIEELADWARCRSFAEPFNR